jgi:hypothetical protein
VVLVGGMVALVDEADVATVAAHRWRARPGGNNLNYAVTLVNGATLYMHRVIMGGGAKEIDHINGDGLDNRRENLRGCSRSENARNTRGHFGSAKTSAFKGVNWVKKSKKWVACICHDSQQVRLGYFTSEEEAARAYDAAALELHGEFARTNASMGRFEANAD